MAEYNAEDGLKILRYLDIGDLTEEEEMIFRQRWNEAYFHQKDPIRAAQLLYVDILPFVCIYERDAAKDQSSERFREFHSRYRESKLKEVVETGAKLKDLLRFSETHPPSH